MKVMGVVEAGVGVPTPTAITSRTRSICWVAAKKLELSSY